MKKIAKYSFFISLAYSIFSCKSVGVSDLEYMIHNKTDHEVYVLWEKQGDFFDSTEITQDTIGAGKIEILAFLPTTISRDIGCDRGNNDRDTSGLISDILILQIHYDLDPNTSKFYQSNPMDCERWSQSRLDDYKTFVLTLNENNFE